MLVASSQNIITISNIKITGNKVTKEDIILRELEFSKNSSFSSINLKQKIEESKQNLVNLKLFNFIEIKPIIRGDDIEITIDVIERWYLWPYPILEISERNFNSWWDEFQASNYSDFSRLNYGVFLNWENFRGRNELLQFKIRKGFKEHYLFSYQVPYFNKKQTIGINANLQLFRRKKTFYKTENDALLYYTNNNKFTTRDYEFNTEFLYRKDVHNTHHLKFHYFISNVDAEIIIRNPKYLNNGTNLSGSYSKLTYQFTNESRDYVEYPLDGYYVHLEPDNSFLGVGFWGPSPADLFRIRKELEVDAAEFRTIMADPTFKSYWGTLQGDEVKTAPKGFNKEHPNIDLIKKKQYTFHHRLSDQEVCDPNFSELIDDHFQNIRPYFDYMSSVLTTDLNGESIL